MDEHGMDTEALEESIKSFIAKGKQPKLIYSISVYQNPTGITLSYERRKHMIEISHKYGIPIFENESYADFWIDGDPLPPAMYGMDDQNSVMYASSFTKLLGCGLRLGFAVFPEPMREGLAAFNFGSRPSHLTAMAVNEYLRSHGDEHIEKVRLALRAKRDAMLSALGENFPPACSWTHPEGGMMVWVTLPEGADAWAALDKAVEAGVKYNPGGMFRATRDGNNHLRLTYSHNTPDEIHEGVAILADVFHKEGLFE
jgi:2-aminoadipate transaminase